MNSSIYHDAPAKPKGGDVKIIMEPVSIIIIHYGNVEYLQACLTSIIENTDYPAWEMVIINNSTADIENAVKTNSQKIIFNAGRNLGYAGSINAGIKIARGKILIIANNDIVVKKNWLPPLLRCLQKDENVAGCQGKILSLKDKSRFDYAGAAGGAIDIFGYPFCRGRIFDTLEKDYGQYDQPYEPFWVCGVCMALKRSAVEKIGGFDEDFFMYGEEIDWCWRAQSANQTFRYVPESIVYHFGSASTQKWTPQKKIYYLHRNHLYLLIKNYSGKELAFILPVKILMDAMTSLYYLFKGSFSSFLCVFKAIGWITLNYKIIRKKYDLMKAKKVIKDVDVKKKMLKLPIAFLYFIQKKRCFNSI